MGTGSKLILTSGQIEATAGIALGPGIPGSKRWLFFHDGASTICPGSEALPLARILWWDVEDRRDGTPGASGVSITVRRGPVMDPEWIANADVLLAEVHDIKALESRRVLTPVFSLNARPPVVLLTSPEPENLRFLKDLHVNELAWPTEPLDVVTARASSLAHGTVRRRIIGGFLSSLPDDSLAKSALERAFLGERPIQKVRDLARECFVSERTLERNWVAARADSHPESLKPLLDLALLLRAWDLHRLGCLSFRHPGFLGIHERTLARIATRCLGLPVREFLTLESEALEQQVEGALTNRIDQTPRSA